MSPLNLDLSGIAGLAPKFQGDLNSTSATPNKRYLGKEGQFADGTYDPIKNYGYLSPSNNTFAALTGSINANLIATEYDSINDDVYIAEAGAVVWRLDGLADSSLTADITVAQTGTEVLRDLEIYEINGKRALFYSYNLADNIGQGSMIGVKGLDVDSGIYTVDYLSRNETNLLATVTGVTGNRIMAQVFTPASSVTFDRVIVPLARGLADDAGYSVKVTIQDVAQTHSMQISGSAGSGDGPAGGFLSIADASQTGLDITGDLSIELWVRFGEIPISMTSTIIAKSNRTVSRAYELGIVNSGSTSLFFYEHAGGDNTESVAWSPSTDTWYHVAVTRNGTTGDVKFYVDGVQQGTTQSGPTTAITNSTAPFIIGSGMIAGNDENDFVGRVDEVRIWNTERSAAQILGNMHTSMVGNESGLKGYWRFDNDLLDATANNNDLTNNDTAKSTFIDTDLVILTPDGTADATSTVNASTITTTISGLRESSSYVTFDLGSTVTKTGMFAVVVEPVTYGDMGASDTFSWFGNDESDTIADGIGFMNDGTYWLRTTSLESDFDFALVIGESQTWSFDVAAGALSMSADADIFMVKADNGFMYVFEDNKVHKVDGTDTAGGTGTITAEVLRFPSYFKCVDAVDTRGRMYIAVQGNPVAGDSDGRSYSEGMVGVYIWDRQSTVVGTRDFVPLYGVRDIKKIYVDPNGDVRVVCIGDDKFTQVRSISSGTGRIIKQLGLSAYPETRDSLKVVNNMTVWLGADGTIYSFGQITHNDTEELYKIGTMIAQATGAFTTGAIFVGDTTSGTSRQAILVAFEDTVTKKLKRWYPHGQGTIDTVAQLGGQGDVYTLLNYLPGLSKITNIHLVMNRGTVTGTGTDVVGTVKLYLNQATSSPLTYDVTKNDVAEGFINLPVGKTSIFAFQMEFEWQTTAALGDGDFCPVLAQVYYEPTTKRM